MQRIDLQGVIVEKGQWSFKDGRTILYVVVSDGEDQFRVILPDGVGHDATPPALDRVTVPVEVTSRDGAPRFHLARSADKAKAA